VSKVFLYEFILIKSLLILDIYYFVYTISSIIFRLSIDLFSLSCLHETISRSLLLITDGTDDRISAIDNSASRELQLSIINSKLPCKNLFHRKCVYLLHDQFDGRKKQKCVCTVMFISVFLFNINFLMMSLFHASCR
jgi:hypothetical protein